MQAQLPKPRKSAWILSVFLPLGVAVLLLITLGAWTKWHPAFLEFSSTAAFRQTESGWQSLPPLPGRIEALRVSPARSVWALIWTYESGSGLARLDGGSWRIFRARDFGVRSIYVDSNAFALDGEDVWVATDKGALHGSAGHWQIDRDVKAESVVAAGGRAWALDRKGHLWHFEAGRWQNLGVEPPDEEWGDDSWNNSTLARGQDGTLWLARNRLWRLDESGWEEVETGFEDVALLGVWRERVWIWDGRNVRSFSMDGDSDVAYSPAQTGIAQEERVHAMTRRGSVACFATARGIVEFDGTSWRRLSAPTAGGVKGIRELQSGPGGELWAVGEIPNPAWKYTRHLPTLVPLMFTLALLGVVIWMVRGFKRQRLQAHHQARQAMEYATVEAPDDLERTERRLEKDASWWGASVSVIVPIAALIGFGVLRQLWPKAPSWTFLVLALAFHLAHALWHSLVKRKPKPWDPIEPGGPGYEWTDVRKMLPGTLLLFLLMNFDLVNRYIGDPVLWGLGGFWLWIAHKMVSSLLVVRTLKRGDYERAGALPAKLNPHRPEGPDQLQQRGLAMLLGGRPREAEEVLRRSIAATRNGTDQALSLHLLGEALVDQGRYDDAMRSFEAALHARDGFRKPYGGMAEMLLRRGPNYERALDYLEKLVGPSGPSWNRWTANGEVRDDYWAVKAWALGGLGRRDEMMSAIEKAMHATDQKARPSMAATCYRCGMAMQSIGEEEAARDYFQRAAGTDPQGRFGGLAKAALSERSVFRT